MMIQFDRKTIFIKCFMLTIILSLFCSCIFRKGLGDYVNKEAIYVSIHGSDENDGTLYTPVKTITRGIAIMKEKGYRTVKVTKGVFKAGEGFDYLDTFSGMVIDYTAEGGFTLEGGWESGFEKRTNLTNESDFTILDGGSMLFTILTIRNTSNVTIDGFLLKYNSATTGTEGGGVYINNSNNIKIKGMVMSGLTSMLGAGIQIDYSNDIVVDRVVFIDNYATSGGGIYISNAKDVRITNNYFENNSAMSGGGIFLTSSNGAVLKKNRFINNNCGGGDSGAIRVDNVFNVDIQNSFFENNSAFFGGALYLNNSNSITLKGNLFKTNRSDNEGGAIAIDSSGSVNIQNSSFENNYARDSGALYVNTSNAITLHSNSFNDNRAEYSGGAVIIRSTGNVNIGNSTFKSNNSRDFGGALQLDSVSNANVLDSLFENNSCYFGASSSGAALALVNSEFITVERVSFKNNNVDMDGGAFSSYDSRDFSIINSDFTGNKASSCGGAISLYMSGDNKITLLGNSFDDNSATTTTNSTINIYSSSAVNNNLLIDGNKIIGPGMGTGSIAITEDFNDVVGHTLRNNKFYLSSFDNYYSEPGGLTKNIIILNTPSHTLHDASVTIDNKEHP